jgi:hypothetical protein
MSARVVGSPPKPHTFAAWVMRTVIAAALVSGLSVPAAPPVVAQAAGRSQGLQDGWAIDNDGKIAGGYQLLFDELGHVQAAGAGWLRINFRLGTTCYQSWTTAGTAARCHPSAVGRTALQQYTDLVREADRRGLKVLALVSNESWPGDQPKWLANAYEATGGGGNGDNPYIRAFASNAVAALAKHFSGATVLGDGTRVPRIDSWEIWNEPNAYTGRDARGNPTGGTYIYPSNFSWLLKRSYAAVVAAQPTGAQVIAGGLFAHDPVGVTATVQRADGGLARETRRGDLVGEARRVLPPRPGAPPLGGAQSPRPSADGSARLGPGALAAQASGATCPGPVAGMASGADSGREYLCATYTIGRDPKVGKWGSTVPFHHVGQHLYIDQGAVTTADNLKKYLSDLRQVYVANEPNGAAKTTHVTEFSWSTDAVTPSVQAQNLETAYTTFNPAYAGSGSVTFVGRAYWFRTQDTVFGDSHGLVDTAGTPKPSFAGYQRTAAY